MTDEAALDELEQELSRAADGVETSLEWRALTELRALRALRGELTICKGFHAVAVAERDYERLRVDTLRTERDALEVMKTACEGTLEKACRKVIELIGVCDNWQASNRALQDEVAALKADPLHTMLMAQATHRLGEIHRLQAIIEGLKRGPGVG